MAGILSKKLVWLDSDIHSKKNQVIKKKFQSIRYQLEVFQDHLQCEQYLQTCSADYHIILIVHGQFSLNLIPNIHDYRQIHSIYVYSLSEDYRRTWLDKYHKIKKILLDLDELVSQISYRGNVSNESFSMSIHGTNLSAGRSTNALDGRFVHHQLLIDCLLRMEPTKNDKQEFLSYCKTNYPNDLKIIKEFEETYTSKTSIYWYTKDSILYRILNESLRKQDIDLLFCLRFFIRDLQEQLQQNQCQQQMILYRGQRISRDELTILQQSQGKLISMNSFLSTTIYLDIATTFCSSTKDEKYESVIFEIHAGSYRSGMKPFANVELFSEYPQENESLVMLGAVFRLDQISQNEQQIWFIHLTLCSDSDHDLELVFNHMRKQYEYGQTRLLLFGHVLVDMGHFDDAEKYYHRLLKEISNNHPDLFKCCQALGKVCCEQSNYELGLQWLKRALEIIERMFGNHHVYLGFIYLSIGEIHLKKQDYSLAFEAFEKAREIWIKIFRSDKHEYIAWCWNNIGMVYIAERKYSQAFECLSKALEIKKQCLPPPHPCLANTYLNLGNVSYYLKDYDQARKHYQLAYEIYSSSLPYEHPSLATAKRNIGLTYEREKDYENALIYYQKSAQIRSQTYSKQHPDSQQIEQDICRMLLRKNKANEVRCQVKS